MSLSPAAAAHRPRSTTRDAGDSGLNPALGKQRSRDYPIEVPVTPTLPCHANPSYQEALYFKLREWTKGGCCFLLMFVVIFWLLFCCHFGGLTFFCHSLGRKTSFLDGQQNISLKNSVTGKAIWTSAILVPSSIILFHLISFFYSLSSLSSRAIELA